MACWLLQVHRSRSLLLGYVFKRSANTTQERLKSRVKGMKGHLSLIILELSSSAFPEGLPGLMLLVWDVMVVTPEAIIPNDQNLLNNSIVLLQLCPTPRLPHAGYDSMTWSAYPHAYTHSYPAGELWRTCRGCFVWCGQHRVLRDN
jgi:hypothetical protein